MTEESQEPADDEPEPGRRSRPDEIADLLCGRLQAGDVFVVWAEADDQVRVIPPGPAADARPRLSGSHPALYDRLLALEAKLEGVSGAGFPCFLAAGLLICLLETGWLDALLDGRYHASLYAAASIWIYAFLLLFAWWFSSRRGRTGRRRLYLPRRDEVFEAAREAGFSGDALLAAVRRSGDLELVSDQLALCLAEGHEPGRRRLPR